MKNARNLVLMSIFAVLLVGCEKTETTETPATPAVEEEKTTEATETPEVVPEAPKEDPDKGATPETIQAEEHAVEADIDALEAIEF